MTDKFEFQTEIKQLLDLMIHSLYQNRDIFLRELISNASDALDKARFESLTNKELQPSGGEFRIWIEPDKEKKTLTISDNGIGMNHDDLVANLGTIARSGTKEFIRKLNEEKDKAATLELIGQFGVGFYSSFIVSRKVSVLTRRAGDEKAWRWESEGDGSYTIDEAVRPDFGTSITLQLKDPDEDEADYTEDWKLKEIVKRYSDFISYPIRMNVESTETGSDGNQRHFTKEETLNAMKTLWSRAPDGISKEEHAEFYKHIAHDWTEPLKAIHFSAEGLMEYTALLYIPSQAPFDLFMPERRAGIQLFAKRVLIMDECDDLLPDYLRFVKGVVDSADITLNISRETIQQNRQLMLIRKRLVKKVLDTLKEMLEKERDEYLKFWSAFGRVLKEGIATDHENLDRLKELLIFQSTHDAEGWHSLAEYCDRMKPDQDTIYFLTGEDRRSVENSPHLEGLKEKGFEVIFFTDPIDEMVIHHVEKYGEKSLKSVGKGDLGSTMGSKEKLEKDKEHFSSLVEYLQDKLKDVVKEVRISTRLTSSPVCLVTDEHGMAAHLEKLLKQSNQPVPPNKRILEINPNHPLIARMQAMFDKNRSDENLVEYTQLLYGQAAIREGVPLTDSARYAGLVTKLMISCEPPGSSE